jgi:hypothetical protein
MSSRRAGRRNAKPAERLQGAAEVQFGQVLFRIKPIE